MKPTLANFPVAQIAKHHPSHKREGKRFFDQVKAAGVHPATAVVWEVGVGPAPYTHMLEFIRAGARVTMVEPVGEHVGDLLSTFSGRVTVLPYAVGDKSGHCEMTVIGGGSFVEGVSSPEEQAGRINLRANHPKERVRMVRFDMIDPGNIDVLSIDTEGSDWYVMKHMVSRPKIVECEWHMPGHGRGYVQPDAERIRDHMVGLGYRWTGKGSTGQFVLCES